MRFLPGIAIFSLLAGAGVSARQNPAAPREPGSGQPRRRYWQDRQTKFCDRSAARIQDAGVLRDRLCRREKYGNRVARRSMASSVAASGTKAASIDRSQVRWREEQTIRGQRVVCVFTRSNPVIVSFGPRSFFPGALAPGTWPNFSARIRVQKDLAEGLLMAPSFDEEHGYVVDPRALVAPAK
jgi:hypothetical protein